ncbi:MAG TPA: CDF family Co(II)/Ni(II) efflux transporter DmeF [Steroidobacteraceae bacterium]|jgi:cation diffusion facilitator family transporter
MHTHSIARWQHTHAFLGAHHERHERRTWLVVALTTAMMVAEIAGGTMFGSMALLADGWHMSTHASALAIAALAYSFARHRADDARFSFGTGKLGELAGYSSALILAMIAVIIAYESVTRLLHPVEIDYQQAVVIAVLGLSVNVLSAWLLRGEDHHGHAHHADAGPDVHHVHDHASPAHEDHNMRAAYIHVLADALTSVLAIGALLSAWHFGFVWIDPLVGIVGAGVIVSWAVSLIRSSGAVLLDTVPQQGLLQRIRALLETGGDRVTDLHLWRVGPGHAAAIVSILSDHPEPPDAYKKKLSDLAGLSHVTVEVRQCPDHALAH